MKLTQKASGLTRYEYAILAKLSTPAKIQDYLNDLPFNFEKEGDTQESPRRVLAARRAHCIEGALLAATALWIQGEKPLIMNLSPKMGRGDFDHVVTLYKRGGYWGAISKTNHTALRYRDPVYKTLRELVLSYFHEWYLYDTGEKLLECYSKPLDLTRFGTAWITAERDLWDIAEALSVAPHYYFVPKTASRILRPADPIELAAGKLTDWSKGNPGT